jgi:hypothetical protein
VAASLLILVACLGALGTVGSALAGPSAAVSRGARTHRRPHHLRRRRALHRALALGAKGFDAILAKLEAKDRSDAAMIALKRGLIR